MTTDIKFKLNDKVSLLDIFNALKAHTGLDLELQNKSYSNPADLVYKKVGLRMRLPNIIYYNIIYCEEPNYSIQINSTIDTPPIITFDIKDFDSPNYLLSCLYLTLENYNCKELYFKAV